MNSASAKRIDIISDTHGYLSPALLDELKGADLIIHAGDLTSEMDYTIMVQPLHHLVPTSNQE